MTHLLLRVVDFFSLEIAYNDQIKLKQIPQEELSLYK